MPQTFEHYRQLFPDLYAAVKGFHLGSSRSNRGHGFDHDVAVAQMAAQISPDEKTAEKAWVAGLLHTTDRLVENRAELEKVLQNHLLIVRDLFTAWEIDEIYQAVLRHDQPNRLGDTLTQQVLMDADRLVNLQPLIVARAGQHYPDMPAIELQYIGKQPVEQRTNPASSYGRPMNVMDDVRGVLEWEHDPQFCLRIPAAIERGKEQFAYIREFLTRAEQAYAELGLAGMEL